MGDSATLLRLQEIDVELMRRDRELKELPQRERIEKARAAAKKLASQTSKIIGQRKDLEIDIADNLDERASVEEEVTKTQGSLEESNTDHRALRDFELKLTDLAKRLEKLDFDRAALEERLEGVLGQEQKAAELKERIAAEEQSQLAEYKSEIARIAGIVDELKAERAHMRESLEQPLLASYDAACKKFKGIGVESLSSNKPTVCRVALQPSQISDLRGRGEIAECPYCKRIIVLGGN